MLPRPSSSLVVLMLLAAACGGQSTPAVAEREAAEPVRDAAPARPWFGPNDGLDNIVDGFGAAIDEVRAPPHFELLEHYPPLKPDILLERFGVTTTTDLADGSATQSVSQCVRSFYAGKTGADFTALIDGASGRGWKKEALGDVVVFLDEAGDRPLMLAPASEGDPTLPKELGPALLVEQCRRFKPESGAANIKGRLSFDWRLKPIKELAEQLERLPDELYWGRVGDRAVGAGTLRLGHADEAAVTKWISDHGFVARPQQKKNDKQYALGDDALTVELTVAGGGDSRLLVVKTTTPWPAK